jgi:hypothetical protein
MSRQIGGESLDALVTRMFRSQAVKSTPHFGQHDCGEEKVGGVLRITPRHQSGIGPRFPRFADGVGVEDEVQSRKGLAKSSGIRGGSQSVVPRTESCHALSFCMERRTLALCRAVREGCL